MQRELQQGNERNAELEGSNQEIQVQLGQQLHSVQAELREANQKSSDQMKLLEEKECDFELQASFVFDFLLLIISKEDVDVRC